MKTVQVSTDVFAAIWSARKDGESSEDAVLRRLLKVASRKAEPERDFEIRTGFSDTRYGVTVEPGFQIFRRYLGKDYRAQAVQGMWILAHTGMGYTSLNELSQAIGATRENAWASWYYMDSNNKRRPVSDLRDQSKIVHRRAREHERE